MMAAETAGGAPPPVPVLPSELWLHVISLLPTPDSLARVTMALGRTVSREDCEPAWRAWVHKRWGCAPREVHKPWRRFFAERLGREREAPSIFYVAVCKGEEVLAEACVAPGGYPRLWRDVVCGLGPQAAALRVRCAEGRRWVELRGRQLGLSLTEEHEPAAVAANGGSLLEPLVCSLREGDGVHRLACMGLFRNDSGASGTACHRAAAAASAEAFLQAMHGRFVYQLFASRLPQLPAPAPPAAAAAEEEEEEAAPAAPGDALALALRRQLGAPPDPRAAAAAGRATLELDLALELELSAWQRAQQPAPRNPARAMSALPSAAQRTPRTTPQLSTALTEALQQLKVTQAGLVEAMRARAAANGQPTDAFEEEEGGPCEHSA